MYETDSGDEDTSHHSTMEYDHESDSQYSDIQSEDNNNDSKMECDDHSNKKCKVSQE